MGLVGVGEGTTNTLSGIAGAVVIIGLRVGVGLGMAAGDDDGVGGLSRLLGPDGGVGLVNPAESLTRTTGDPVTSGPKIPFND
jgi:hypothetical protein